MAQLWGGRFTKETDQLVYNFNASISFDQKFYKQDIEGSIAHVCMLGKQGILTQEEMQAIVSCLQEILADVESGKRIAESQKRRAESGEPGSRERRERKSKRGEAEKQRPSHASSEPSPSGRGVGVRARGARGPERYQTLKTQNPPRGGFCKKTLDPVRADMRLSRSAGMTLRSSDHLILPSL